MRRKTLLFLTVCFFHLPLFLGAQPNPGSKADVDNNGQIDVKDMVKILTFRMGYITLNDREYWRADCNAPPYHCDGDGVVNILDAVKIANIILGDDQCPNIPPTASFTTFPLSGTTKTFFFMDAAGCSDHEDSKSALQVRWDWENDGQYDTDWRTNKTSVHQYSTSGTKTIILEVRDTGGATDTASNQVSVEAINTPPTASFSVDPPAGTRDVVFTVDASGSFDAEDPDSALQVRWDWENDDVYDTGWTTTKIATHQYATEGTKTIRLEVMDSGGLTDTETHQVIVGITVTDIDGNLYRTVTIGDQVWMAENLKVTRYRNGDPIPHITADSVWSTVTAGAYCHYDNNENNGAVYGGLYNWYAVSDSRQIAPNGWHVPSDEDWKQLELSLGIHPSDIDEVAWRGTNEGGQMKTTGTLEAGDGLWLRPNSGATNECGFSALPGGYRYGFGASSYMGAYACFWSTTESRPSFAWYRRLDYDNARIFRNELDYRKGFSVRCVRD